MRSVDDVTTHSVALSRCDSLPMLSSPTTRVPSRTVTSPIRGHHAVDDAEIAELLIRLSASMQPEIELLASFAAEPVS